MWLQYLLLFCALVWLVAVFKVFVLDEEPSPVVPRPSTVVTKQQQKSQLSKSNRISSVSNSKSGGSSGSNSRTISISRNSDTKKKVSLSSSSSSSSNSNSVVAHNDNHFVAPIQNDFLRLLNEPLLDVIHEDTSHLQWPPVAPDGTIPSQDGYDIMPIIDLKVPKFWVPKPDQDWNQVGTKVNGEDTIFLMIASYRDFQCRETITSAFMRADHPERLYIGAVDQIVPGDTGCLDLEIPCSVDNTQPICKYRDQISIFVMDAQQATGPVTARHVGDRMYRGQTFVMQMDAHCQFVRHWDTSIIDQWKNTHNEMAVLSSYLTDVQESISPEGDSLRKTRPIMCNSDFEGLAPARYLRHGAQPEEFPEIHGMPQLEPYWAAGFSFSRGHFKLRVPYDAYQPMVFQGEEIAIGIRGFTYGYDFYAPEKSVVFHEYAVKSSRRRKVPMFWENNKHAGEGVKSLKRAVSVIHMANDIDEQAWDHRDTDRYGLGKVRTTDLFYKLFLIDVPKRTARQLCPFVKTGIMHKAFQPYLRSDGVGIDYSNLLDYDTKTVLENFLESQHPYWIERLNKSMERKDIAGLQEAVNNAVRVGLDRKKPQLVKRAREMMEELSRQ